MTATASRAIRLALCCSVVLLSSCGDGSSAFSVGGTVTGLSGSGLVLQNNAGNDLPVSANGNFTFPALVGYGKGYAVTVKSQPSSPAQTCAVTNGSGTVRGRDVTDVVVTCTTVQPTVSGTVSGLSGTGLVLQNNGGDDLSVAANGGFAFPTTVAEGAPYAVTVKTQPGSPAQSCSVTNGSGTMGRSATNVVINCADAHFALVTSLSDTKVFAIDDTTGALSNTGHSVPVGGILAATLAPSGKHAYLGNVIGNTVHGYAINPATGSLSALPGSPYPTGASQPQAVAITPSGKFLYAANRAGNSVTVFAIDAATGALATVGAPVATGSYPIYASITPSGKFLYIANYLGGSVSSYAINAVTGALTFLAEIPATISDPRFMAIDPGSRFIYVTRGNGNSIYGFAIDDASGAWTSLPGSPYFSGNSTQNMAIDSLGKFLYATNETDGTVSAFTIDAATGDLSAAGPALPTGGLPEGLTVAPNGKTVYVTSQSANAIASFTVNASTGALSAGPTFASTDPPIGIAILGQ